MELTPVESSNIAAVGHADGNLHVRFKSGAEYIYPGAPYEVYEKMVAADSVGRFFNANIVGRYGAQKVEKDD